MVDGRQQIAFIRLVTAPDLLGSQVALWHFNFQAHAAGSTYHAVGPSGYGALLSHFTHA